MQSPALPICCVIQLAVMRTRFSVALNYYVSHVTVFDTLKGFTCEPYIPHLFLVLWGNEPRVRKLNTVIWSSQKCFFYFYITWVNYAWSQLSNLMLFMTVTRDSQHFLNPRLLNIDAVIFREGGICTSNVPRHVLDENFPGYRICRKNPIVSTWVLRFNTYTFLPSKFIEG